MSATPEVVQLGLTLGAAAAPRDSQFLGHLVHHVAQGDVRASPGAVCDELVDGAAVGGMDHFSGSGVPDVEAAALASAGGELDPGDVWVILPVLLLHPWMIALDSWIW